MTNNVRHIRRAARAPALALDDVTDFIARFVIVSDAQRLVLALWVVHTHLIEHVEQTPYLSITSPDPECGKSRLLDVLQELVARPWPVVTPSEAVAYRYIHQTTPTLLLDEVDTIFSPKTERYHEGLRAIINAGHRRGFPVPRCVGATNKIVEFNVFCAKALAGIGTLPDTIAKRSIYIRLQRKLRTETVEDFKVRDVAPQSKPLRERITGWADVNGERLSAQRPEMPAALSDRMQEGCESLVAIADALGAGDEARAALVELVGGGVRLDEQETMRSRLLRDVRDIWTARETEFGRRVRGIPSAALVTALHRIEAAPWSGYYGRGLDASDLANLLRHYGIKPRNIKQRVRVNGEVIVKVPKGYNRDELHAAFERYLSSSGSAGSGFSTVDT